MALVFFYPQFKKLTGAERLILKLAGYTARRLEGRVPVVLLTHRFAEECRPALDPSTRLVETGWPMELSGNHYIDAAIEYALGPALALRLPGLLGTSPQGVIFFGPPSVPAMWVARRLVLRFARRRVPVLYFCFEPPRFIYSDTEDIVSRLGILGRLLRPAFQAYRALDRRMVGAAHRVLSNSPYGSSRIRKAYGRHATVIEHGVDFAIPKAQQMAHVRERYGLDGKRVAVTVNHLHPRKRIDLFLRAVHEAGREVPNSVALVVGGGPERERLVSLAEDLGMEVGRDAIFTGVVPEEELPAHYAAANVYVHTGRQESFGLSVIEALKLGLPVVSVDEGGPISTVQHGVSGFLEEADPRPLGSSIARLLADPALAERMGRAGADFVSRHFDWERGVDTLLHVLDKVEHRLGRP